MPGYQRAIHFWLLMIVLGLAACDSPKMADRPTATPFDARKVFPAANAIPGWSIAQELKGYDRSNLFNLVDGQAESFFAYGFVGAWVQRYQDEQAVLLNLEIWQLATEADAYGLFSGGRAGDPVSMGSEGDSDSGRRLAFWQSRYFVSLNASKPVPDETLQAFARAVSGALPSGGEHPALVDSLPQANLVPLSPIFFHEEMSIQMQIWLGGENILGLSQQTDGVVARYQVDDKIARLVVVEYPDAAAAAKGLQALQGGGLTDLLASGTSGKRLGAVFGKVEQGRAEELLKEALK